MKREPTRWLLILPGLLFLLLLTFPVLALLLEGIGRDFLALVGTQQAQSALRLSLASSLFSLLVALVAGTPLAFILARWRFRGRKALELLVDLPIVMPPSVAGLGLLMAFGRRGLLGGALEAFGIALPFTTAAVVLAQVFVAGPLYVRAARIGFAGVSGQLEEAATTEGASQWQMFRHVMIPGAWQALVGGALLSWARALGEFGATILFAGNLMGRTQTMPLAIYLGLEQDRGVALALSVLLLGVSAGLLGLLRRLERNWSEF